MLKPKMHRFFFHKQYWQFTNSIVSFQKKTAVTSDLSAYHKVIQQYLKTSFQKSKPEDIFYRNYKVASNPFSKMFHVAKF